MLIMGGTKMKKQNKKIKKQMMTMVTASEKIVNILSRIRTINGIIMIIIILGVTLILPCIWNIGMWIQTRPSTPCPVLELNDVNMEVITINIQKTYYQSQTKIKIDFKHNFYNEETKKKDGSKSTKKFSFSDTHEQTLIDDLIATKFLEHQNTDNVDDMLWSIELIYANGTTTIIEGTEYLGVFVKCEQAIKNFCLQENIPS
jgi:hypothetical protein